MHESDDTLVDAARAGDDAAYARLVARYQDAVYSFAVHVTGNTDDATDAAQETFVKAWKHLGRYRAGASMKTWLFTIAKNSAFDLMRKRRHVRFSDFDTDEGNALEATLDDDAPLPDELAARADDAEFLEGLLATVSPAVRAILLLHDTEDLTFEEIGHVVGKPMNTVKSQYRRAIARLRAAAPKSP